MNAPLPLALLLAIASSALADSKLSAFRESFRGTASLESGTDTVRGTAVAAFNSARRLERGSLTVDTAFHIGQKWVRMPALLRFNGRVAVLSLGVGSTRIRGTGRARIGTDEIRFSVPVTWQGKPTLVTGRVLRSVRGIDVTETFLVGNERAHVLSFRLRSPGEPGEDRDTRLFQMPGRREASGNPGVISWENGAAAFVQGLAGGTPSLRIDPVAPAAFEKEGSYAAVRISRSGGAAEVPVDFVLGGSSDPRKGSASPADYRLHADGNILAGHRVKIPANTSSVDIRVLPTADGLHEVPETLTFSIPGGDGYGVADDARSASVTISDATDNPANDNIFIAYLVPPAGVASSASGISTIHLRGDNSVAFVDLSFSGLTSSQLAAHINAPATSGSGPDIKGLPRGQVTSSAWTIAAAQFLATDQAVLDALFSGRISVSVLSGSYSDGEIAGNYVMSDASADPRLPDDPPPEGNLTGEPLRRDVARFLMQATFGPTRTEIDALVADIESRNGDRLAGYSAWIDAQFALDQTRLLDYVQAADAQEWALRGTNPISFTSGNEPGSDNRRRGWWTIAASAHDQLRQRVALALEEIFVVSDATDEIVGSRHYGAANYHDMLAAQADGDFRTLLGHVTRSPVMGKYLSSLRNQKAVVDGTGKIVVSPDENYAREVMQLFSIGLVQLNIDGSVKLDSSGAPMPTYTNTDITELARVLTGWSFSRINGSKSLGYPVQDNTNFSAGYGPQYFQAAWTNPMKNFAAYHDTGAKVVLGATIPEAQTGDQDLDTALDLLANHPNTAPFIARRLIQRLVTSNPSAGYIYRVAKAFDNDGAGRRGSLRAVIRAILLDREARNASVALEIGHGRQKEPMLRHVQLLRALGAASQLPLSDLTSYGYPADQLDNFPASATRLRYPNTDTQLGQTPLRSPTVFNWFLPAYSPPGAVAAAGLVAPEMQLTTETQVIQSVNYRRAFTESDSGQSVNSLFGSDATLDDVKIDRSPHVDRYKALIAAGKTVREAVTAVVDDLDLLLAGGRLRERYETAPAPNPRSILIDAAVATSEGATSNDRVKAITYLLTNTPAFLHQP